METPEFPPNSEVSKKRNEEDRDVKRVTTSDAVRRKRPLRKQFKEVFVAGDMRSATRYALLEVFLPAAKDMVIDTMFQGMEKLFFGDTRRRGPTTPYHDPRLGVVDYRRYSAGSRFSGPQRAMSRIGRARHNFDEIVLEDRTEAEEVIDRLFDLVSRYDTATVADLYELVGLPSAHTDHKWGWTNLSGAGVSRTRNGYLLDLPEPYPLSGVR